MDFSCGPDNDFVELLWENGQIVMQNQSYRARKNPPSIKDAGNAINSKMGKFGSTDSIIEDFQVLVPSVEMGMNQDDEDMVPWFNYPINDEYCSDLLHEIAGVTVNEHKTNNEFTPQENISFNKVVKESHNVASHSSAILEQEAAPKFASLRDVESTITKSGDSCKGYRHQQPLLRANNSGKDLDTVGAFPSINGPTQNLGQPSMSSNVINFSHFARSAALLKANLHSNSNMPASDPTSRDGSEIKDKVAVAGNVNLYASKLQNSEPTTAESEVNGTAVVSDEFTTQVFAGSSAVEMLESEKIVEPVVVSSVCSGDGLDGPSNDPKETVKRKCPENESSDGPSEDIEEESVIGRKASTARGGNGYKRSRAAEVHNLSERRRRDRINEKMRALQELIPNCNKVDKASMLDEAIDYLKTLQLQVQIMSMGSGLCMPPMMYPTGMQHLRASHMGHFAHMGTAMGMGMNFQMGTYDLNGGSLGYPMFPASPMANACSPPITASSTFARALGPNLQAFMIPGQGLPMPMPHSPFIPMHGGPPVRPTMGKNACGAAAHVKTLGSVPGSSSRDVIQNMNMQSIKKNDAKWSTNQMCSQATNQDVAESVLLKERDQATGF